MAGTPPRRVFRRDPDLQPWASGLSCIRRVLLSLLVLSPGIGLFARPGEEEAEYRILQALRDRARAAPGEEAARAFDNEAQRFLRRHPGGRRASIVELWRGDLLKGIDDRAAWAAYRNSREPEAASRAADLAFRNEPPPPLQVDRWVGGTGTGTVPGNPAAEPGPVHALVFFSETHPVTRKLLPHLVRIEERLEPAGLRLVGVAAVVDDHANQRPERLAERLETAGLPFPIAIDEQRSRGRRSASLERYRGDFVPWCVLIDRYGRIAWLGGLALQGNAIASLERELERLTAQPTAEELARRAREGDVESVARLAAIRTRAAAGALVSCLGSTHDARVREVLAGLLPEDWDALAAASGDLKARWDREGKRLAYDFERDRLRANVR